MKVLFLTNNDISYPLIEWLNKVEKEDVQLLSSKLTFENLVNIKPDFIVSYNYHYIIRNDIINLMKDKIINLHISLLPWNRGAHPNIWSFLEDTPKGVTIHLIDEGIDTGDILISKEMFFNEEEETLKTSYNKLHTEIQLLFKENWVKIKAGKIKPIQQSGKGTIHYIKDFNKIEDIIKSYGWDIKISEFKNIYQNRKQVKKIDE